MENKQLIDELYFCAGQCTHCYDACRAEKEKDLKRCIMLDQDCADICRLTGQLLERNSENAGLFIKLCGEICEKCADECDNIHTWNTVKSVLKPAGNVLKCVIITNWYPRKSVVV